MREIPLQASGVYPFHCDVDLHAVLGMRGRIEVEPFVNSEKSKD